MKFILSTMFLLITFVSWTAGQNETTGFIRPVENKCSEEESTQLVKAEENLQNELQTCEEKATEADKKLCSCTALTAKKAEAQGLPLCLSDGHVLKQKILIKINEDSMKFKCSQGEEGRQCTAEESKDLQTKSDAIKEGLKKCKALPESEQKTCTCSELDKAVKIIPSNPQCVWNGELQEHEALLKDLNQDKERNGCSSGPATNTTTNSTTDASNDASKDSKEQDEDSSSGAEFIRLDAAIATLMIALTAIMM